MNPLEAMVKAIDLTSIFSDRRVLRDLGERVFWWEGPGLDILRVDGVPFALKPGDRFRLAETILDYSISLDVSYQREDVAAFAEEVLARLDSAPFVMLSSAPVGWLRARRGRTG